jgi:hypothetical protein
MGEEVIVQPARPASISRGSRFISFCFEGLRTEWHAREDGFWLRIQPATATI